MSNATSVALHQNEMPHDLPAELKRQILAATRGQPFNRYPEPFGASLAEQLTAWYGVTPEQLLVGPGSSSFIRLLLTYFALGSPSQIVIARPSFAYYEQFCIAFNIPYTTWELDDDYQYDISRLAKLPSHSVVFLASPNNPTGNPIAPADLEALLRQHASSLFVVDEAYAEFAPAHHLDLLRAHDNLLILRTFSKAFSAAGIRCGVLIGDRERISTFAKLQTPWQLSAFTIEAAQAILDYNERTGWAQRQIEVVIAERERLFQACRALGGPFTVYPSQANFLLIKAATAQAHAALLAACTERNIIIENLTIKPRLANCVRVTIGTPEHNQLFAQALEGAAHGHTEGVKV